jgi:crotonobetainyl-CoA:carnitine CoA-transferase CaiB-like acyl-CoA transferase
MECLVTEFDVAGIVRQRTGAVLPGVAPSNVYPCSDGEAVLIAANGKGVFARLCAAMGKPELARSDSGFWSDEERGERQAEIDAIVAEWTSQRTSTTVLEVMREHAVPGSRIYRAADMLADPHFAARKSIVEVADRDFGRIRMQGVFPRLSATPGAVRWAGPGLGEHNSEVYAGLLGMSVAQMADLQARGVI